MRRGARPIRAALATWALCAAACGGEPEPPRAPTVTPSLAEWASATARNATLSSVPVDARLRLATRIHFADAPDRPHRLTTTWDGDRMRSELAVEDDPQRRHAFEYVVDGRAFARAAGEPESVELEAGLRDALVRRAAARLAVWSDAGGPAAGPQSLPAGGRLRRETTDEGEAWVLEGPPGTEPEVWTVLARDPEDGRPLRVAWSVLEQPIWTAERLELDPRARFGERWFWPPDRWSGAAPASSHIPSASAQGAQLVWRQALEERSRSWPAAWTVAEAGRAELGRAHPALELQPRPAFLLDGRGIPTAFEWSAADPDQPAPEGWQRRAGRTGVVLHLARAEAVGPEDVDALGAVLGPDGGPIEWQLLPAGGPGDPAVLFAGRVENAR